ncbi:hypothetical protein EUTSA_v10014349mg [Eutrema salsugineum]|uniref:Uncharacterized protein n=1 Tax=Eutrema salsugineum TaxID=72664 RepID=V4LM65_EUTSA|nr:hypothetical protein EUTSA_v10014349mg [Eutrema salsugineum]
MLLNFVLMHLKIRDEEVQIAMLLAHEIFRVHIKLASLGIAEVVTPTYPMIDHLNLFSVGVGRDKQHSTYKRSLLNLCSANVDMRSYFSVWPCWRKKKLQLLCFLEESELNYPKCKISLTKNDDEHGKIHGYQPFLRGQDSQRKSYLSGMVEETTGAILYDLQQKFHAFRPISVCTEKLNKKDWFREPLQQYEKRRPSRTAGTQQVSMDFYNPVWDPGGQSSGAHVYNKCGSNYQTSFLKKLMLLVKRLNGQMKMKHKLLGSFCMLCCRHIFFSTMRT